MTQRMMERIMAVLLIVCFLLLSWHAARASAETGEKKQDNRTVVVDPGHGGKDPGMTGAGGLEEKGINLEISLKLRDILEKQGFNVVLTRDTDRGLYDEDASGKKLQDLQRRTELIRKAEPLLTVSIHQNSYSDPDVKGPQVFYFQGSDEGKSLAEALQKSLNEKLEIADPRSVKGNSSYYLLKKSPSVTVIAECGFLTNPSEAEKLQDEAYQYKVAEALTEGIEAYLARGE
ncbi:MAG: N-acetylmuramoyl-L-alanine amidase family protein [Blautia sp.]